MADVNKFSGDIYLGPIDSNGDFQGYYDPIEVEEFVPGRDLPDPVELKSKRRDTYGQTIASEQEAGSTSLTMVLNEQPTHILAMAFAGDETSVSVSSATVTDELVVINALGRSYQLAERNIDAENISVETSGDVALTEDTDWELVDARLGLIRAIVGGAITAGDTVKVTYDHDALEATKIIGETNQTKKYRIYADLKNIITAKDLRLEYHEVVLTAPDVFDLLSSDFISATVEGNCLTPTGKTGPYEVIKVD